MEFRKNKYKRVIGTLLLGLMILSGIQTLPVLAEIIWEGYTSWHTLTLSPHGEYHSTKQKYFPPHYVNVRYQLTIIEPVGATIQGEVSWCPALPGEPTWPWGGNVHVDWTNPNSYSVKFKYRYKLAYEYPFP